jgi:futalosine hydrolase
VDLQAQERRRLIRRVLLVTAVPAELDAVARGLAPAHPGSPAAGAATFAPPGPRRVGPYDLLAVGVGPAASAAATAAALARGAAYGLVVCLGIGGGFAGVAEEPGTLVVANEIVAADLGAESPESPGGFLPLDALGFGTVRHRPPLGWARGLAAALGAVCGPVLTVSTATGSAATAAALAARHPGAAAEGMEGFGVAAACAAHGVPVLEIRAVSNPVGPRDRDAWQIPRALAALERAAAGLAATLAAPTAGPPPTSAPAPSHPSETSP